MACRLLYPSPHIMRTDPMPHFAGWTAAAIAGLAAVVVTAIFTGCAASPADGSASDPNAGLLRDFLDGKYDSAGHPLNARVSEAETICANAGSVNDTVVALSSACTAKIAGGEQSGDLVASARLAVRAHAATGDIATVEILDASGTKLAGETLTVARLRAGEWIDWPVAWSSTGGAVQLRITPATGAQLDFDYVEVFPQRFGLVLAPGSGVAADSDHLTFELPADKKVTQVELDGTDITAAYQALLDAGTATVTTTSFRKLIDVAVSDLAPARGDVAELKVHTESETARMQLRKAAPACMFEGSGATKVVVTGFQPFPADGWHDNVSGVAVSNLDVSSLHDVQVLRVILPVEYDRAAAEVSDVIARCHPDVVISFGQGGDAIALEHTAYNLQDTGEVAGGVPDNRGIVRAAQAIDPNAAAERPTLLPLDAINAALVATGEAPQDSTDPGRYICNNVMFADLGAIAAQGHGRAGFIHLPYTTDFDAATKARFANVVATAISATVAH
jgi:pyroglutamyl-peptidase